MPERPPFKKVQQNGNQQKKPPIFVKIRGFYKCLKKGETKLFLT